MLDAHAIRDRFPALQRTQGGEPVIFFDNPAGTQIAAQALEGYTQYLLRDNANVGGSFATSEATDAMIAEVRQASADFLGAASPNEIVFGPNMTTLTFSLSHALSRILQPGDEIITTRLEHDANVSPWLALQERGVVVKWIDLNPEDGTLDLERAEGAFSDRTRLLAVGYASNALGTINDVRWLTKLAHSYDAWVFVDAVHYGPHGPIDVQDIGCDLLACSAYKFFGPHLGILYGRLDLLEHLPAYHVRPAGDSAPDKWETGTKSHEALASLAGAFRYLASLADTARSDRRTQLHDAMARIKSYERTLAERLIGGLGALPGVRVFGITDPARFDQRVPTAAFVVEGRDPAEMAAKLAGHGIFTWAGNHYALEPLQRLGIDTTQRIGLVHYNTPDEIDRFLEVFEGITA